jgi:hypothetical protein
VFSTLYVIGCLVAVLAVQQSAVFTAVIQPPLVLFVTVPVAYFLMHNSQIQGIKDILINCGYPLIERFPLMFFTSATVLLIGLARWYFGKSTGAAPAEATHDDDPADRGAGLSAKLSSLLGGTKQPKTGDTEGETPRERRAADRRKARGAKPAAGRTARKPRPDRAAARSRHARPSESEIDDPIADRPRRRRPRPDDAPSNSAVEPRRRPRPSSSRDPRDPREPREPREARGRRVPYDRDDPFERRRRPDRPERTERPQRRRRLDDYVPLDEPLDPYGSRGTSSHHPISRVRYRGGADEVDDQPEYRPRRRPQRDADRWEYDI